MQSVNLTSVALRHPLPMMKLLLLLVTAVWLPFCIQSSGASVCGLTSEQRAWLVAVTRGNATLPWPPLSANQSLQLQQSVEAYQQITEGPNHPYNQAVEVWFSDKNRTKIVAYDDVGDGAAWTGLHLAALVHEYIATKKPTVMDRIWAVLETFDMMTICTKKTGFIPRFVGLATDPLYMAYYAGSSNGAFQCTTPYEQYIWLGYTSRDMYFGVAFGLANTWVWLSSNSTVHTKVQLLVERIVDSLKADHFWIIPPERKEEFQVVNPVPLYSATWRQLAMAVNYNKYKDMEPAYILDFLLAYEWEMSLSSKTADSYYPNELTVEGMHVLALLDKDKDRREKLMERFSNVVVKNADHLQPGFAAFYLSAFPNATNKEVPLGVLQGGLYDYPLPPNWDHHVDQSNNPMYMPHYDAEHSDFALLIHDRPPTTYLWQRAPTKLKGGESACCFQRKHLDLILPYWMGRSSGHIKATPFLPHTEAAAHSNE